MRFFESNKLWKGVYFDIENFQYCSVHQHLKDDIRKALAAYPQPEDELGIPSVQIDVSLTCVVLLTDEFA